MNWTQFLLSIAAIYSFYYVLNVLFDLFRSQGYSSTQAGQEELVFSEETTAQQVGPGEAPVETKPGAAAVRQVISSGSLQSTGAVSLKQLFSLAQSDLIEYTKAIPY